MAKYEDDEDEGQDEVPVEGAEDLEGDTGPEADLADGVGESDDNLPLGEPGAGLAEEPGMEAEMGPPPMPDQVTPEMMGPGFGPESMGGPQTPMFGGNAIMGSILAAIGQALSAKAAEMQMMEQGPAEEMLPPGPGLPPLPPGGPAPPIPPGPGGPPMGPGPGAPMPPGPMPPPDMGPGGPPTGMPPMPPEDEEPPY